MSNSQRVFRSEESFKEEAVSRDAIAPFLSARGYAVLHDQRTQTGTAIAQFLRVQAPDGQMLQMTSHRIGFSPPKISTARPH
ncbi:hypothetical protein ACQUKI_20865 [Ralstonia pseudosolanacearum]